MKPRKTSLRKKVIVGLIITVLVCGLVVGVIYGVAYSQRGSIIVVPVSDVNYYDVYEETEEMEGEITFGTSQKVIAEPGKQIVEIPVQKGDQVKKGDVIAKYDSKTAQDNLSQRNMDVTSVQNQIDAAQNKLNILNSVTAREVVDNDPSPAAVPGRGPDTEADSEDTNDQAAVPQRPVTTHTEYVDSQGTKYESMAEVRKARNEQTANLRNLRTNLEEAQMNVEKAKQAVADCDVRATMDGVCTIVNEAAMTGTGSADAASPAAQDQAAVPADDGGAVSDEALDEDLEEDMTEVEDDSLDGFEDEEAVEEEASEENNVAVQISAFDGLFVKAYISEWTKASTPEGSKIYLRTLETGDTYEAEITEISPYADESYAQMVADAGLNISYYPMTAMISSGGDELKSGQRVKVLYSKKELEEDSAEAVEEDLDEEELDEEVPEEEVPEEEIPEEEAPDEEAAEEEIPEEETAEEGSSGRLYIMKAFIITENGKKYAYIRGKDGKLVKRRLTVDGQADESYIVTKGLSENDYIAFPYLDSIREGAKTRKGSIDDLYGE